LIKLIHTADIHLDSPLKTLALRDGDLRAHLLSASRQSFSRMVDYAIDENVAALLVSGDLFDGIQRSAKTAAYLIAEFDRLAVHDVEVFYIKGNHDAENPVTGGLSFPDNVHVFSGRGGKKRLSNADVWIHGVSFSGKQAPDSLLDKFDDPVPAAINIAMLHTSLAGSAAHDVYAPCSVDDLKQRGFDYWALGHIHKREVHSQTPWVVMPGIPQGRDIGESGAKCATVLSIVDEAITIAELPTSSIEFVEVSLDISDIETAESLRTVVRDQFAALVTELISPSAIVRCRLTGRTLLRWELLRDYKLWFEIISRLAVDTGQLWLEKLKLDLDENEHTRVDASAIQELTVMMGKLRTDEWFINLASAEVEAVLSQLPAGQRAHLLGRQSDLHSLTEQLCAEGGDYLIAAMRGESS